MSKIFLFDVDGTLTEPRQKITDDILFFLRLLRTKYPIAIVGGSDLAKQREQLGNNILKEFDYIFSENGLIAYKDGELFHKQSIKNFMGQENMNLFINTCLHYLSELHIPVKTGTFIELRNGMFNISPIGRNCSQQERKAFKEYDEKHYVMENMITYLNQNLPELKLKYSIGGEISFDVFPEGWDKTYCLQFLKDKYSEIYFFGDKTHKGGNDYEIYNHPLVKGYNVLSPKMTKDIVELILSQRN